MAITASDDRPVKKQLSDSSPNGYNRAELYSGVALTFDGVNDYIDIGDIGDTVKTVICWIKPDSTTEKVIDLDGGTHVLEISSGTVTATGFTSPTVYVDGYSDNTTVAADVWVMIAATTSTAITANDVDIGRQGATYYGGEISNVMLFSEQLTDTQIENIWLDPARPVNALLSTSDLAGWWPLFENSDNILYAIDYSDNNNPGTITGATYVQGIERPVLQPAAHEKIELKTLFSNGNTNYLSLAAPAVLQPNQVTVSAWLYCNEDTNADICYIGGCGGTGNYGYLLYLTIGTTVDYIRFNCGDGASSTNNLISIGEKINDNRLVHVVGTFNAKTTALYFNGTNKGSVAQLGNLDYTGLTNFTIGQDDAVTASRYHRGGIISFAVWDKALSAAEVTTLYNAGVYYDPRNLDATGTMIGYWQDNGPRTWTDLSGNGNDLTYNGTKEAFYNYQPHYGAETYTNYQKSVLTFSGDEYGEAPDIGSLDITGEITLCAWVKPDSTGSQQTAVAKNLAYELAKGSAETVIMSIYQTTNKFHTSTATLALDTWTYICGTYDGSTMIIYINGEEDSNTTSYSGAIDSNTNVVQIGANAGSTKWTGGLDEVKIYNTALTADEIRENYRATLAAHP